MTKPVVSGARIRRSARVLVVDSDWRILLFRCDDPHAPDESPFWLTPGGAINDGEAPRAAAARELFEETGYWLDTSRLEGPVAVCEGDWSFRGEPIHSIDTYFIARVAAFDPDRSMNEAEEREIMQEHHWCTAADIDAFDEVAFPGGLAGLLREIIAGHVDMTNPRVLPWT